MIEFSIGTGRNETVAEIQEMAHLAEEVGFAKLTVVDQPQICRDVHVLMTAAALATERIRIGHGVTQTATMHPLVIANGTATIDELSGGRAFIGIGPGGYAIFTKDGKFSPLGELRQTIDFLRRFMAGED